MTIWKFALFDTGTIEIPHTHRILSVGTQDGIIFVWALVDPHPHTPKVIKKLTVVGTGWTGWQMDGIMEKRFIGTVQDGPFVWHVFE